MKSFLKYAVVFVLGLLIGGAVTGFLVGRRFNQSFVAWQMNEISKEIVTLEDFRNDDAELYFKSVEKGIPEYVLMIDQNDEMKRSGGQFVLEKAKEFYLCTKTPFPKNIEKILEAVKLSPDHSCNPK